MVIKVNGYTFGGSNSVVSSFDFNLDGGQLLMERICSCRSKFFPLTVDFIEMRAFFDRKDNS